MSTHSGTETSTVVLAIDGMTCGSCERHVRDTLTALPGVSSVSVDRTDGLAVVHTSVGAVSSGMLIDAVRRAGYDAAVAGAPGTAPTAARTATCGCCGA